MLTCVSHNNTNTNTNANTNANANANVDDDVITSRPYDECRSRSKMGEVPRISVRGW